MAEVKGIRRYMKIYENEMYQDDVAYVAGLDIPWEKLREKSIMISGATGLVGSFLIDVIMHKNKYEKLNCGIYALGRDEQKMRARFGYCYDDELFHFFQYDVNNALLNCEFDKIDFILHMASNTHPRQYATAPIETITTNIIGLQNMLEFAVQHDVTRFAFTSSNEIYGENRGDTELFDEEYCGYIDCNTLRAGYPESKRCGEALCQAYASQKGIDVVIPRITRSYGPTLLQSDTKALSQFLRKAIAGENIVLKSKGTQYFSYLHVVDTVSGLLTILLKGKSGEAYNISDAQSDIRLKDLAQIIASYVKKEVVFELPDDTESMGFSKATIARLNNAKLCDLGWKAKYNIREGLERTIDILKVIDEWK